MGCGGARNPGGPLRCGPPTWASRGAAPEVGCLEAFEVLLVGI